MGSGVVARTSILALGKLKYEDHKVWGQTGLCSESLSQKTKQAEHQWLRSVILANWEAEIGRTVGQGQPKQTVLTLHLNQ
jgi:hypothetical protein